MTTQQYPISPSHQSDDVGALSAPTLQTHVSFDYFQMSKTKSAEKPLKIAIIHDSFLFGGIETYLLKLVQHLDKSRYAPTVLIPTYTFSDALAPFYNSLRTLNIDQIYVPTAKSSWGEITIYRDLFREHQFDLINIHTCHNWQTFKATIGAKLAGVPVVRTEHVPQTKHTPLSSPWLKMCLNSHLSQACVVVGETEYQERSDLWGSNARKTSVIRVGIDLAVFNPNHDVGAAKQHVGLDTEQRVVGFIGRLCHDKRPFTFIEVAKKIAQLHHDVSFVMVGGGDIEQELQDAIDQAGLSDRFTMTGLQENPEEWGRTFDVALFTSGQETFGLVRAEFLALGKPLVTTDILCDEQNIRHGVHALIAPVDDVDALTSATHTLLSDDVLATQLAQNGAQLARSFDIHKAVQQTQDLYEKVYQQSEGATQLRPVNQF